MTSHFWPYFIDTEGHFWNSDGIEFDDPETLHFFMEHMEPMAPPDKRFRLVCQGEECRITAQDVPYVVRNLEFKDNEVVLIFPGNYRETLKPETLFVGKENVLYCKVRGGQFPARFNRATYWEITKKIEFDPQAKAYYLNLGSSETKKQYIQGA